MKHKRNTQGLKDHAQQKHAQAVEQTEKAIRQLIKEGRPINFSTVEDVAGVSRTWLYNQPEIRDRIEQLRDQQSGKKKVARSQKASDASNAAMARTLKEQTQKLQVEKRGLIKQMEEVVGRSLYADEQAEHYKREAEKLRAENAILKQQLAQCKQPAQLGVVETSNSQSATSITPTSPQQEAQQKIDEELTQLGIRVNSPLSRSIRSSEEQTVLTAVAALRNAMEAGQVKNPAGWLRQAIEDRWQPNDNNAQPDETNNLKLFNEWFPLAKSKGLIVASTQNNGDILVLTANDEWLSFSQVVTLHPLESLK